MQETKFNYIEIVQWLRAGDRTTGKELFDSVVRESDFADSGFTSNLRDIDTRAQFASVLDSVARAAENSGLCPVLHIESHGSPEGIGTDTDPTRMISWHDIKPLITRINVATRNRLLVILSCCHGGHLASIIQTTDRSPCWGLVGPVTEVSDVRLLDAYTQFYGIVLNGGGGSAAIAALNSHLPEDTPHFLFTTSRDFFRTTYKKYLDRFCTDQAMRDRAKEIQNRGRQLYHDAKVKLDVIEGQLRGGTPGRFEQHKVHFFMYDLDEENRRRFQIDWSDMTGEGPTKPSTPTE
jgi:hypothetical protein